MGESVDRAGMLVALSTLNPPESVPINALVAVEGPMEERETG
jgi:biotin synthase-like enzyme